MRDFDIKGLSSVSVTYDKVLTDEDIGIIRNDFVLSFNNIYMEKIDENVVVFIVPTGMMRTLKYYLENKPLQGQEKNREKFVELLSHIRSIDHLQVVCSYKVL